MIGASSIAVHVHGCVRTLVELIEQVQVAKYDYDESDRAESGIEDAEHRNALERDHHERADCLSDITTSSLKICCLTELSRLCIGV